MQKWEHAALVQEYDTKTKQYYWDDKNDERTPLERMNELGQEGWQLAAIETLSYAELEDVHIFYLKRLVSE